MEQRCDGHLIGYEKRHKCKVYHCQGHLVKESDNIFGGNRSKHVDCKICSTLRVAGKSQLPDFIPHLCSYSFLEYFLTKRWKRLVGCGKHMLTKLGIETHGYGNNANVIVK